MLTDQIPKKAGSIYNTLTEREVEVLELMSEGKSNSEIANKLIISEHTAKAHVGHILQKFEVHDRVQAVVFAMRKGIIE